MKKTSEPVVYIVHHQNLKGPFFCMAWFPILIRLWVLDSFFEQNNCYHQYVDYTFTKRFDMPKLLAICIAFPLSFGVSKLLQSSRSIPVFRGSKDIAKTIRSSVSALIDGESLLICPDVDYSDKSFNMGDMHDGFLNLEKYYWKETGYHLAFIPLCISKCKHRIYVQEAVYFQGKTDFKQEKAKVSQRLKQELSNLEKQDREEGDQAILQHKVI